MNQTKNKSKNIELKILNHHQTKKKSSSSVKSIVSDLSSIHYPSASASSASSTKLTSDFKIPKISKKIKDWELRGEKYEQHGITYNPGDIYILGLLYLLNKYHQTCFPHDYNYYAGYNGVNKKPNIFYIDIEHDSNDDGSIIPFANRILTCLKSKPKILIILFNFFQKNWAHANALIYRRKFNTFEHYEPHGIFSDKEVPQVKINSILKRIIYHINYMNKKKHYYYFEEDVKYISPEENCPTGIGFQKIENQLPSFKKERGFCALWSLFFLELSLLNPELSNKEIYDNVNEIINTNDRNKNKALYVKHIIRGYLDMLYERMDKWFKKNPNKNMHISDFEKKSSPHIPSQSFFSFALFSKPKPTKKTTNHLKINKNKTQKIKNFKDKAFWDFKKKYPASKSSDESPSYEDEEDEEEEEEKEEKEEKGK
jgi:hypothetical protein